MNFVRVLRWLFKKKKLNEGDKRLGGRSSRSKPCGLLTIKVFFLCRNM